MVSLTPFNTAVDKMTAAIEVQTESNQKVSDIDKRVLRIEEHIKRNEEFWKPIKSKFTMVIFGFLMAGLMLASVAAYNKVDL